MQFSAMETLMIALLVLGSGQWLVHRVSILSRLNMPEPVVGGLLATIIVTGLQLGGLSLTFDESMKIPSMLFFFGAVGLAADFRLLKQGGWAMLLFAVLVIVLVALQDLAGVGMAKILGLEPYYGLIGGSVTMTGGHGTGAAWAGVFEKDFGLTGVSELAAASATFGLIFGALLGGPLAMFLIRRYRLAAPAHGAAEDASAYDKAEKPHPISAGSVIRILMLLSIGVVVGKAAAETFASVFRLPTFVWVLFVCILLGNTARRLWKVNDATIDVVGNTALGIFLAITLMSLQLLQLVDLALPMLAMLIGQVLLALAFITFVTFRLMGRNYDSAVLCAGHCGFAMGATPTAVANIQSVTQHHGPSPLAFIIVPVVGGFIVDIANATIIQTFVSMLSG
ncbi:MAG: sodium:glutamate symporter [Alcanivorax borkumensis]|jgi:ESS family glutamate:Na+ symporter|uniref:Sodium/glutamate symporter n=1 Tax=Alcanivorax borkumensis (strain ATCC 700651 / DSM 11573 / NCIMB 13689 / SK2) TaxID=393595 RepID=Q0VP34_ALCBS|nr:MULTISPECIES: sodium/glutamate symporter [Alcanivorax]OJH08327.1 MAG: sodium:glutamate symporter [Alcanivorax borkumensis]BAP14522.1 sodium/glutamate symport carrier protein [Alcanivorax sp. NBRC 101098]CAL17064.1 sodium/glutamate symport carrier protein [Alcanivorax borkumensis SK2]